MYERKKPHAKPWTAIKPPLRIRTERLEVS